MPVQGERELAARLPAGQQMDDAPLPLGRKGGLQREQGQALGQALLLPLQPCDMPRSRRGPPRHGIPPGLR